MVDPAISQPYLVAVVTRRSTSSGPTAAIHSVMSVKVAIAVALTENT